MDNKQNIQQHSYTISIDILMDILRILLPNKMRNYVEAINEKQNSVILRIETIEGNNRHILALRNIEEILEDYGYYTNGIHS